MGSCSGEQASEGFTRWRQGLLSYTDAVLLEDTVADRGQREVVCGKVWKSKVILEFVRLGPSSSKARDTAPVLATAQHRACLTEA